MPAVSQDNWESSAGTWHLLTGEYPPQSGGVSDYCALIAAGLAAAGDDVHVWAPPVQGSSPAVSGVVVHREAGTWTRRDLSRLDLALDAWPAPRRLLIQYTPNAWGWKGLNLGFSSWISRRKRCGDAIAIMIHEVAYPFRLRDRPWRWILPLAHRRMIRSLLAVSDRVYHSNCAHGEHVRRLDPRSDRPLIWLPVPSTVPILDDPEGVAVVREALKSANRSVVGVFSPYGNVHVASMLDRVLPALLSGRDDRVGLLLGRGGDAYAESLCQRQPSLQGRLIAPGMLSGDDVSRHLRACDLMVLPYADGISTRRTTAMAALAHGRAVVTCSGHATEPIWADSGSVMLTSAGDASALVTAANDLLADASRRSALETAAADLYATRFTVEKTVSTLRADSNDGLQVDVH